MPRGGAELHERPALRELTNGRTRRGQYVTLVLHAGTEMEFSDVKAKTRTYSTEQYMLTKVLYTAVRSPNSRKLPGKYSV